MLERPRLPPPDEFSFEVVPQSCRLATECQNIFFATNLPNPPNATTTLPGNPPGVPLPGGGRENETATKKERR